MKDKNNKSEAFGIIIFCIFIFIVIASESLFLAVVFALFLIFVIIKSLVDKKEKEKKELEKIYENMRKENEKFYENQQKEKEFYQSENILDIIDNMDGQEFEDYLIKKILPKDGYTNLQSTTYTGDYGVDIIGYKDNVKCAIQCKRANSKISNSAIQEVVAGRKHYKCDKSIVITNNYYTENAKQLAFDNKVELLDRDYIIRIIKNLK